MRAKYDFQRLRDEFIRGGWLTVAEFFRAKGIPSNSRTRSKAKGWRAAKAEYLKQVVAQTQQKAVESEVEIRLRQQKAAKYLQLIGLQKLETLPVETTEEARKLIVDGLQQEREALGLDGKHIEATQVNIGFFPKTELDKFIEQASYEEVLEMIAELKRLQEVTR